jgi:hypothetical protein
MEEVRNKQLSHLFLRTQVTTFEDSNAKSTSMESIHNHKYFEPFLTAISMVNTAPISLAYREV